MLARGAKKFVFEKKNVLEIKKKKSFCLKSALVLFGFGFGFKRGSFYYLNLELPVKWQVASARAQIVRIACSL